jgi:hypothetical protein
MMCKGGCGMRRILLLWLVPFVLGSGIVTKPAWADDNKILEVAKCTIYGGATGLLVGGVLTLVVKDDNRDDVVRWGVVIGTFGGLAYGLYDVSKQKEDGFTELVRARAEARQRKSAQLATGEPSKPKPGGTTGRSAG